MMMTHQIKIIKKSVFISTDDENQQNDSSKTVGKLNLELQSYHTYVCT